MKYLTNSYLSVCIDWMGHQNLFQIIYVDIGYIYRLINNKSSDKSH